MLDLIGMEHGRNHDERQYKRTHERYSNVPPDEDKSKNLGAEKSGPEGGSRPAPTRKAEAREAERHRLEREMGRFAAGEGGIERDERVDVSREQLDEAARDADRAVDADKRE